MGICRLAGRELIWNGELRARQLGKTGRSWVRPMKSEICISVLIVCVLLSGAAIAQGQSTSAQSATAAPLSALDTCLGRLDPELDIGYDRIAARCPELAKQLERGAWVPWLPRGWKEPGNDLSAGGLKEFRELVDRESAASDSRQAPDIRRLKGVLNGLAGTSDQGWWSRLKAWLRSILETREQAADESWFTRMVS